MAFNAKHIEVHKLIYRELLLCVEADQPDLMQQLVKSRLQLTAPIESLNTDNTMVRKRKKS